MKKFIANICRLGLFRNIWHRLRNTYTDEECYDAFIEAMNTESKALGMKNTQWINSSGLGMNGDYSQSTANDLAIMAIRVFSGNQEKYHESNGYVLSIHKPFVLPWRRTRKKMIYSTVGKETMGEGFPIVGAKTGSGDGYQTLVMVWRDGDTIKSGAIMNAKNEEGRFEAMEELMNAKSYEGFICKNARNACLYAKERSSELKMLFAQEADEKSAPMSTTKVMTLFMVRKYEKDMRRMEYVVPFDTKRVGNDVIRVWDRLSVGDLVNAMMRTSSNVSANTLARLVGRKILEEKEGGL